MSRQRSDPAEVHDLGPLFQPALEHLYGRTDPETSRAAACSIQKRLGKEQQFALDLVTAHPGRTAPELGAIAAGLNRNLLEATGLDKEVQRQRIGRRLNELTNPPGPGHVPGKPHLIERRGERDGCSIWFPL